MNLIELTNTKDPELNGRVSQALHTGRDFSYWLSLLGPWADERPNVAKSQHDANSQDPSLPENYYRQSSLAASATDLEIINTHSQLLQRPQLAGFRLWQSMHPDPLSLHNDALRLEDEVIENCEFHVRERLKSALDTTITPDPTLLDAIIPIERQLLA